MQRFKNILAHVDIHSLSTQGLSRAVQLAKTNQARLTVVATVEEPSWLTGVIFPQVAEHWRVLGEEAEQTLRKAIQPHVEEGGDVQIKVLHGHPWQELIRQVLRDGHDLLVKDIEGEEGIFSDHTDSRLLRKCPCPVWLVKRRAQRFRRIAAAVDVHPDDHAKDEFNAKICELAASLAWQDDAELHIVRAWYLPGESLLASRMSTEELNDIKKEVRDRFQENLQRFVSEHVKPKVKLEAHVIEGEAADVLPNIVEQEHDDLLVMGTLARSGVAGMLIGNTAESILRQVNCSVLAVKPDGFVSPVHLPHE